MFNQIKSYFLTGLILLAMTGCASTKYIPSSYFQKRHDLKIRVKPIPAPSHLESSSDTGLLSSLVGAAVQSGRAADMRKVFSDINAEEIRTDLQSSLSEKIKEYYNVNTDSRDLIVSIEITSWGWILPTGTFGIRLGSYQLQFSGDVRVFDVQKNQEIANISLSTQEEMRDQMNKEETKRRVRRAVDEFAEISVEFLRRSDKK